MTRYISIGVCVLLILAYWGYYSWQQAQDREARRVAAEARSSALKADVLERAKRANAITSQS